MSSVVADASMFSEEREYNDILQDDHSEEGDDNVEQDGEDDRSDDNEDVDQSHGGMLYVCIYVCMYVCMYCRYVSNDCIYRICI